jgi:release factor glutamine methyltransferase
MHKSPEATPYNLLPYACGPEGRMTVRETLVEGTALLTSSHIDTPALDASLLLAEVLGEGRIDRARLILMYPDSISDGARHRFKELQNRRLAGDSVAYILGRKEFRGLEFTVSPAVLVPRPDTETLVEAALLGCEKLTAALGDSPTPAGNNSPPAAGSIPGHGLRLLDLCTGSGAVAIALKHEVPGLEVWAADISEKALKLARINAERLLGQPVEQQQTTLPLKAGAMPPFGAQSPSRLHFIRSDLFARLQSCRWLLRRQCIPERFHLITANPPYVGSAEIEALPIEVKREPRLALDGGADGLDIIRRLIAGAPEHLYPGGGLLLEADPRQMKELYRELETKGFKGIQTYRDLSGAERVISGYI